MEWYPLLVEYRNETAKNNVTKIPTVFINGVIFIYLDQLIV